MCVCEFCISLSCIVYDVYNTWFYLIIDTCTCMHVYIYAYLISWLSCILVFGFRPTSLSDLIGSYLARNCRCIDDRKCQYGEYRFDGKNMEEKHGDETSVLSISVLDDCQYTWKARCLKKQILSMDLFWSSCEEIWNLLPGAMTSMLWPLWPLMAMLALCDGQLSTQDEIEVLLGRVSAVL